MKKVRTLHTSADGRSHTYREWADLVGISYSAFMNRVKRDGFEKAISREHCKPHQKVQMLWHEGRQKSATAWADFFNVPHGTFSYWVSKQGAAEAFRLAKEAKHGMSQRGLEVINHFLCKHPAPEWEANRWITEANPTA